MKRREMFVGGKAEASQGVEQPLESFGEFQRRGCQGHQCGGDDDGGQAQGEKGAADQSLPGNGEIGIGNRPQQPAGGQQGVQGKGEEEEPDKRAQIFERHCGRQARQGNGDAEEGTKEQERRYVRAR